MMKQIIFGWPGCEEMTRQLILKCQAEPGFWEYRSFPDGESYIRIDSEVAGKQVVVLCSLDHPDPKAIPLFLLCKTIRELDAKSITLLTPYLPYLRQDRSFKKGESVSARHMAGWISGIVDRLITVEPHLHRIEKLSDVFSIPAIALHSELPIAEWLLQNVQRPLIVGPDSESKAWVASLAKRINAPSVVLDKIRHGDRKVEISLPDMSAYQNHQPVIVDDIISTASTMKLAVYLLRQSGLPPPVVIGVHALFSASAYEELQQAGAAAVVSCNTIPHPSNAIDITELLAGKLVDVGIDIK